MTQEGLVPATDAIITCWPDECSIRPLVRSQDMRIFLREVLSPKNDYALADVVGLMQAEMQSLYVPARKAWAASLSCSRGPPA